MTRPSAARFSSTRDSSSATSSSDVFQDVEQRDHVGAVGRLLGREPEIGGLGGERGEVVVAVVHVPADHRRAGRQRPCDVHAEPGITGAHVEPGDRHGGMDEPGGKSFEERCPGLLPRVAGFGGRPRLLLTLAEIHGETLAVGRLGRADGVRAGDVGGAHAAATFAAFEQQHQVVLVLTDQAEVVGDGLVGLLRQMVGRRRSARSSRSRCWSARGSRPSAMSSARPDPSTSARPGSISM